MAKRTGAGSMSGNRGGGRRAGRGRQVGASQQATSGAASNEMVRGSASPGDSRRRSKGGILAGARDIAENFGGSTAETARRFGSAVGGAASGVASRTGDTVAAAVGKVRDNPWPALLIGAGVTWLAVDAVRGRDDSEDSRGRRRKEETGPGVLSRTASSIAGAGRGAGSYVGDFVRERPLVAGAATLGIGMAVGMAMPSTLAEDGLMGNMRDTVVKRAKDAAKGTMEAVRDVADGVERMAGGGSSRERMR